jgi:hypothetical protein
LLGWLVGYGMEWCVWGPPTWDDAPAWVQAIGSIAAILIAVAVPAWQHHATLMASEASAQEEELRKIQIVYELTCVLMGFVQQVYLARRDANIGSTPRTRATELHFAKHWNTQISTIKPLDMPSGKVFRVVGKLIGAIAHIEETIQADRPGSFGGSEQYGQPWLRIQKEIAKACRQLEQQVTERGGRPSTFIAPVLAVAEALPDE